MNSKIAVIGSGFAGLAAACSLAKQGHKVVVFEKNSTTGGRARHFSADGFMFDMGPSWYWMPEVFEEFFNKFGKSTKDYYNLTRLDPSYRVFFKDKKGMDIPADIQEFKKLLDGIEPGAGAQLDKFLAEAKVKYDTGMGEFVWKPSLSFMEFAELRLLKESFRLQLFTSMSTHIRKFFKNPEIIQLLEFPVLFLGAKPAKTPALYSMMNYADIALGTWYPQGGMVKIAQGMTALAEELGVEIHTNATVEKIVVEHGEAVALVVNGKLHTADVIVGGGDYHHIESKLLEPAYRSYDEQYWDKRTMSPSSLLFYLGINKKVDGLLHHNLFFDEDFDQHAVEIYDDPKWPSKPLFYICAPSKTDNSVAPEGCENLFALIPVAPDMSSDESLRDKYLQVIIERIKKYTGVDISENIVFKRSYAHEEFMSDYNSFKGNAYGLANTLMQTAFLKPKLRSKKIENLYYTGQLTTPGPGVPPSLISGQVVAEEVNKYILSKPPITV
ncbi:MAG: phytoene desaturase family protein [Flavobacteriales bacterium]|jgi:phytoene desaturase